MSFATNLKDTPEPVAAAAGMTRQEVRASSALASVFALRMLGLFMLSPVFALYARGLEGGDNAVMVGLALGMFSLVQAFFQIPFGMASDRFGRKPVILTGLALFVAGALICAFAHSLVWIMIGRGIQGLGAISAAITALVADSTREQHRTKAMAMIGGSIGLTFALAMVLSPVMYQGMGMAAMFGLTAVLGIGAMALVKWIVPDVEAVKSERVPFRTVLMLPELMRLNAGVFVLHFAQMAMFVVLPAALVHVADIPVASHWKIYLPVMLVSFVAMLPAIFVGEKYGKMKPVFLGAIALLLVSQIGFWLGMQHGLLLITFLFVFFIAFNTLEASQPSLVSRLAPPAAKGAALGVYNTMQALGIAAGAASGGLLTQYVNSQAVFALCAGLTLIWLIIAASMPEIARRSKAAAQA
ncbi:MFS transporter [Undibacterium luofuense]|uniref:MFS transporter n=1 Tax=Undibacterium luofuense TaxID=2828733 RepID=UPI0030EED2CF